MDREAQARLAKARDFMARQRRSAAPLERIAAAPALPEPVDPAPWLSMAHKEDFTEEVLLAHAARVSPVPVASPVCAHT